MDSIEKNTADENNIDNNKNNISTNNDNNNNNNIDNNNNNNNIDNNINKNNTNNNINKLTFMNNFKVANFKKIKNKNKEEIKDDSFWNRVIPEKLRKESDNESLYLLPRNRKVVNYKEDINDNKKNEDNNDEEDLDYENLTTKELKFSKKDTKKLINSIKKYYNIDKINEILTETNLKIER
jgi:hypothetical protein